MMSAGSLRIESKLTLEPVLASVQLVHLLLGQLESVELQVVGDTGRSNGLQRASVNERSVRRSIDQAWS